MGDITTTRLNNCRKVIEKQAESFGGGFTVLQVVTLKAMLKTLKRRVIAEGNTKLLEQFNFLFDDIMSFEVAKN